MRRRQRYGYGLYLSPYGYLRLSEGTISFMSLQLLKECNSLQYPAHHEAIWDGWIFRQRRTRIYQEMESGYTEEFFLNGFQISLSEWNYGRQEKS